MEKRFEKVISIFGISMAGGVFVPIRRLLHASQVAHIVKDSGAKVLITAASRFEDIAETVGHLPGLKQSFCLMAMKSNCRIGLNQYAC